MVVPGGEDDGSGLVSDDALGDAGLAELGGSGADLLRHRLGAENLKRERVAIGSRLELIDLGEDWLPLRRWPLR